MIKAAVIIANGSEEIEALTPVDVLRRAGVSCDIVSVSGEFVVGSHGITIKADLIAEKVDFDAYDAIIVSGGMPGAINMSEDTAVLNAIGRAAKAGKIVAAICASPAVVLARNGLLATEKATCYPAQDFISALGDKYTGKDVQVSENFITANGPRAAMAFALEICKKLGVTPAI